METSHTASRQMGLLAGERGPRSSRQYWRTVISSSVSVISVSGMSCGSGQSEAVISGSGGVISGSGMSCGSGQSEAVISGSGGVISRAASAECPAGAVSQWPTAQAATICDLG